MKPGFRNAALAVCLALTGAVSFAASPHKGPAICEDWSKSILPWYLSGLDGDPEVRTALKYAVYGCFPDNSARFIPEASPAVPQEPPAVVVSENGTAPPAPQIETVVPVEPVLAVPASLWVLPSIPSLSELGIPDKPEPNPLAWLLFIGSLSLLFEARLRSR